MKKYTLKEAHAELERLTSDNEIVDTANACLRQRNSELEGEVRAVKVWKHILV